MRYFRAKKKKGIPLDALLNGKTRVSRRVQKKAFFFRHIWQNHYVNILPFI